MKQEDKELLLKDLYARLPYGVKISTHNGSQTTVGIICTNGGGKVYTSNMLYNISQVKPYLRPMSSMTEEERKELLSFGAVTRLENGEVIDVSCVGFDNHAIVQDYLNSHHFDYRGLIEKGLAIAVTEENNPYK